VHVRAGKFTIIARFMDLPALACTSNLHEPHQNKNHSLTKLAVWKAYIKTQIGIATQVSVIKVKVTLTKNRNSVSAQ